ncbi:MAG: hypothetical protein LBE91_21280 [Tannerella sp.]|nr:hypothetical protein [Tannerella sp.]
MENLSCEGNQLTALDKLYCSDNQLTRLLMKNGKDEVSMFLPETPTSPLSAWMIYSWRR